MTPLQRSPSLMKLTLSSLRRCQRNPSIHRRLLQLRSHITIQSSTFATANPAVVANMDAQTRQHYLADSPPSVVRLEIKPHFEALNETQQRYAHFMSR